MVSESENMLWNICKLTSDVNKDWTHKDKDLTYKDSKQKRRQAQHSFFLKLCH